jgi:hypothetical protein
VNRLSLSEIRAYYGAGASGIFRPEADYPSEARTYFAQYQDLQADGKITRWYTSAAFDNLDSAVRFAERMDGARATHGTRYPDGGFVASDEQPITTWRAATLADVMNEGGPEHVGLVMLDLMLSDHEWIVSSDLGSAWKVAAWQALVEAGLA